MNDEAKLVRYALCVTAALVRDLDAAGLLSDATRKLVHNGLAEIRDVAAASEGELEAALLSLDQLPPAADG